MVIQNRIFRNLDTDFGSLLIGKNTYICHRKRGAVKG